LTKKNIQKRSI